MAITADRTPARSQDGLWLPPMSRRYRPEIAGVRGLALVLVVAYHLFGDGRVSGGVDVFLVVSAYLLTSALMRLPRRGVRSALVSRYARTFARLVPQALVVLVAVLIAGLMLLPESRWVALFREVAASALYVENVELAQANLAYGAAGHHASPLQHFWSLSLQGQFFLWWPAAVVLMLIVTVRCSPVVRHRLVLAAAAALTLVSFCYAANAVAVDHAGAYFSASARLWEFGVGACAALALGDRRIGGIAGGVLPWMGVSLIVLSGWLVDGADTFPGPAALVPVSGILLVLVAGRDAGRWSVANALTVRPLAVLSTHSYALYLWHWPVLVGVLAWQGEDSAGPLDAVGVLAVSGALAVVSTRLGSAIGSWLGGPQVRPAVALGMLAVAVVAVALTAVLGASRLSAAHEESLAALSAPSVDHPGASALDARAATYDYATPFRPAAATALEDRPAQDLAARGCIQDWRNEPGMGEVLVCEGGIGSADGDRRLVVTGGSHTMSWLPALRLVAEQQGWEIIVVEKDGCLFQDLGEDFIGPSTCEEWNRQALDVIVGYAPDAVVTVGTRTAGELAESMPTSQVRRWKELDAAGIPVVTIRDNPRFPWNVPECVLRHPGALELCGRPQSEALEAVSPFATAAGVPDTAVEIDMTAFLCPEGFCAPVIGNVLVYRDDDHISATYARSMAPMLTDELREALPSWFR